MGWVLRELSIHLRWEKGESRARPQEGNAGLDVRSAVPSLSCSGKESAERVGKGIKCAVERWLSKLEPTSESPAGPRPRFLVGGLGRWGSPSPGDTNAAGQRDTETH